MSRGLQVEPRANLKESQATKCSSDSRDKQRTVIQEGTSNAIRKRFHENEPFNAGPRSRTEYKAKSEENSMVFVPDNSSGKTTVKEKANLYTQFINERFRNKPKVDTRGTESMEPCFKKSVTSEGKVVLEKQLPVKQLVAAIESKCTFPIQTISPMFLKSFNCEKISRKVSVETEDSKNEIPNTNTPAISAKRARSLSREHQDHEQYLVEYYNIGVPNHRNAYEICSPLLNKSYETCQNIRRSILSEQSSDEQEEEICKNSCEEQLKSEASSDYIFQVSTTNVETEEWNTSEIKTVSDCTEIPSGLERTESGLSSLAKTMGDDMPADTSKNTKRESTIFSFKKLEMERKIKMKDTVNWLLQTPAEHVGSNNFIDSGFDCKWSQPNSINTDLDAQSRIEKVKEAEATDLAQKQSLQNHLQHNLNYSTGGNELAYLNEYVPDENSTTYDDGLILDNKHPSHPSSSLGGSFNDQGLGIENNDVDGSMRVTNISKLEKQDGPKESMQLFIKLDSKPEHPKKENPVSINENLKRRFLSASSSGSTRVSSKYIRKSLSDTCSRRSSLVTQVIPEGQLFEPQKNIPQQGSKDNNCRTLVNQTSQYWIHCGDFLLSIDINYNDAQRICLLYEIFGQKSCDTRSVHFGIDNLKFSIDNTFEQENIANQIRHNKTCSHYWFSTGDLAMPFIGKPLTTSKIKRLFKFVKAATEETGVLRFGVDGVEFSNVTQFWSHSSNFSMDSNYSMLIGLQSDNGSAMGGQFAWPYHNPARSMTTEPSEKYCECFRKRKSYRLSATSPFANNYYDLAALSNEELSLKRNSEVMMNRESFWKEYENEAIDNLFDGTQDQNLTPPKKKQKRKSTSARETFNIPKTSKKHPSPVQENLSAAGFSSEHFHPKKDTPENLNKLKNVMEEMIKIGNSSTGFKQCTLEKLEKYMLFLRRYTGTCFHYLNNEMQCLLKSILSPT